MKFYNHKKRVELQVGLFTILALIVLFLSYSWLMGWREKRNNTTIRVKLPSIQSVEKGTLVTILGAQKGKVIFLEVAEDGIIMHLLLELDFPLRSGTRFYVKETSLMGDVSVEIEPGKGEEYLDLNTVLTGESGYSISGLIKHFSHLAQKIDLLFEDIEPDAKWGEKITALLDSTQLLVQTLNQIAFQNKDKIHKVIANTESITSEIQEFTDSHKTALGKTIEKTGDSIVLLESSLTIMQESLRNINTITEQMKNGDSDFQEFISEKKMYEQLLQTAAKIDSLLVDIKKNPKRYFQIKVF
jgi:phospholipid/cholesterol/gamma-HCH transport system substrate-binding protein